METTPMGGDGDAPMVGSESTTRTVEPLLDGSAVITVMDQNSLTETKVVRPILWGHMKVSFWDMVMDGIAIDAHDGSIDDLKVEVIDADVTIENEAQQFLKKLELNPSGSYALPSSQHQTASLISSTVKGASNVLKSRFSTGFHFLPLALNCC
ncbi:hypothetical protein V6N11_033103 [Hibiscus sabdariffa]|uniref:Uncharacterized protein n=1 Tax=Hibiscus sabdariffa TaxID=183260 RepID=A0ABR2A1G1_9ROSI